MAQFLCLVIVFALVLAALAIFVILKYVGKPFSGNVKYAGKPSSGNVLYGLPVAEPLPYRRKDYLLSKAERSFYQVLRNTIGSEWVIFSKVRLLDLVWLPRGTPHEQVHRNRVQSKHIDFVLCDPNYLRPVLAIELDDASHHSLKRAQRDAFVDAVLKAAGLPLLHVPVREGYVTAELARQIREMVGRPATPSA